MREEGPQDVELVVTAPEKKGKQAKGWDLCWMGREARSSLEAQQPHKKGKDVIAAKANLSDTATKCH